MRNVFDNPLLLIILLLIIVLIFGSKRLPEAARSVGRSMRIFKTEVKELKADDARPEEGHRPLQGRGVDVDEALGQDRRSGGQRHVA